jgi:hypothetical protein
MKSKILPICVAFIVGTIIFIIGRMSGFSASTEKDLNTSPTFYMAASSGSAQASVTGKSTRSSASTASAASTSASKADPFARMREINQMKEPIERTRLWLQLVESLAPDQFDDFVAAFQSENRGSDHMGDYRTRYTTLLSAWTKVRPDEAVAYAFNPTGNPLARESVITSWASLDPDSAIAWAKTNQQGKNGNPWMANVIDGLSYHDPDRAIALMTEMPKSDARGEALENLMPSIMKRGIAAARDWANAITDPALREEAMMRVAQNAASEDPQGTVDWLSANPSATSESSMADALEAIAGKDQSAALSYFDKLPAGDARSNALRGIINAIAKDNPQRAAELMVSHSADITDSTVKNFVASTYDKNPEVALSGLAHMKNAKDQEFFYTYLFDMWMKKNQKAAIDWASSNTLPPYVVERINRDLQSQPEKSN